MSLRILITGSTGLIGSAIADALADGDFEIVALYRYNKNPSLQQAHWIHCDMEKIDNGFFDSLPKVDAIIHNAAMIPSPGVEPNEQLMDAVNHAFSSKLFHWAHSTNVSRIIFTSTYSFLKKPLPEVITENSEVDPIGIYPASKWKAEKELMSLRSETTSGIALRIPSPVAISLINAPKNVARNWIETARQGKNLHVFGNGLRTMDFVSVGDIAQAFLKALSADITQNEIFNIGSGTTLSMQELALQIATAFGVSVEYSGTDINANDRWNIDIKKGKTMLGYNPSCTAAEAIQLLIDNSKK
ncbi:MAG: NAD-dependent epimerase/dehydratase family protein [Flavobacteriales bacterium]